MNGYDCGECGCEPCACEKIKARQRITQGKEVTETGIDVFSKVPGWKIKIIKWLWPDLQRLSNALYEYWDKA